MNQASSIDSQEIQKFSALSQYWWDREGPLKTLHDINPARMAYIQSLGPLAGCSVLDLGCGGGILSEALAKAGAEVSGIDAEAEAIKIAKAHALESGLRINYQAVAVEQFEHPAFDLICCLEMLEHVADPALILQSCKRLLKPNGKLVLSTINRNLKAYAAVILGAEYLLNLLPRQTHDYQKFIKPSELALLARQAGFEPRALRGLGYNPFSREAYLQESVEVNYLMLCD